MSCFNEADDVIALRQNCAAGKNSITDTAEVYFKKGLFEFYSVRRTPP